MRDFYDLDQLQAAGVDLSSPTFIKLVDAKLAELRAAPLAQQGKSFALDKDRRRAIEAGLLSVDCLKASHTSVHAA